MALKKGRRVAALSSQIVTFSHDDPHAFPFSYDLEVISFGSGVGAGAANGRAMRD
jgi:hypothetical protein